MNFEEIVAKQLGAMLLELLRKDAFIADKDAEIKKLKEQIEEKEDK